MTRRPSSALSGMIRYTSKLARTATFFALVSGMGTSPLAQGTDYHWTGPTDVRVPSGDWSDEGNWSPSRGIPSSFADAATIDLDTTQAYEVRVDRDTQIGQLTLNSAMATLLPTGLTGSEGRVFQIAPGGSLRLLDGRIEGDLSFQLQSGSVELGRRLLAGQRGQQGPVIVVRGPANSLSGAEAAIGPNAPAIAVLADSVDAELTLAAGDAPRQFRVLEGALVTIDAAPGRSAKLAVEDHTGIVPLVNSGEIIVGGTLPREGQAVLAIELQQALSGVFEVHSSTMLGATRGAMLLAHRNHGSIVLQGATITIAPSNLFINAEEGVIAGSGAIAATTPIANLGSLDPGVAIRGDLVNETTASLAVSIRGETPGVDHDQLVVSGSVTLGGTLQVEFADGFRPRIDDVFQIISAGAVTSQFHQFLPPALAVDQAALLVANEAGVALAITEPVPVAFTSTVATADFSEAFGGTAPQSHWTVDLTNVSGNPQQVIATGSVGNVVQGIQIIGGGVPQASMTLLIDEGAVLAASSTIGVGPNGRLVVASGGEAFAPSFEVNGGSLEGGGTLAGDVQNRGHISPASGAAVEDAVGLLTIDGDFVQEADGVLEIDVFGLAPGEHDILQVSGDLSLSGNVVLDLSEFQPTSSFAIEIIDGDGTPVTEEPMCNVLGDGKCTVTVHHSLDPGVNVLYFLAGDFNQDGDVDRDDLAVWQMNAGYMGPMPPPSNAADADNDGDVDGDDLLAVLLNFGPGAMPQSAAAVPEPGSALLILVCLTAVAGASGTRHIIRIVQEPQSRQKRAKRSCPRRASGRLFSARDIPSLASAGGAYLPR